MNCIYKLNVHVPMHVMLFNKYFCYFQVRVSFEKNLTDGKYLFMNTFTVLTEQ